MLQVETVPAGTESRSMLRRWIRRFQADDPLHPVTVAVPSNYAGLALRRALARPDGGDPGGILNVRFLVLPRVIELLGAPVLAARGLRPLTRSIEAELIRAALDDDPGVFGPVAGHPATEQRLAASFRDLGDLTPEERALLRASGGTAADTVRLFEHVETATAGRYYHDRMLAEAASDAARRGHTALRDLGALVVYLPGPLTRAERAFIRSLGNAGDAVVLVGLTGEADADEPLVEQWRDDIGADRDPHATGDTAGDPLFATHLVSVPDAEEEIRTVIRTVLQLMETGTPLHRLAILSRQPSPYAVLLAGQLEDAGLPWNGANPLPLVQTAAGRILLGALRLPAHDFRRADLTAWLAGAPVLQREHGDLVPAHRWDAIARAAGIVDGAASWPQQLEHHEQSLRAALEAHERSDDPAEWKAAALTRDIEETAALRTFVDELLATLQPPARAEWASYAGWALAVLERYAGNEASFASRLSHTGTGTGTRFGTGTGSADFEVEAYRAVADAIHGMEMLGEIRPTVDLATFERVLQEELTRPARRVNRFGDGIFVGRIADAVGADFDHLFLVGMNEGSVPTKGSDDPLVSEHAWDSVVAGGGIHRTRPARQRAEERRTYLAALASAPARTLLAPRADLRGGQARFRSRWFIESASHLAGRRLTNEAMELLHGSRAESWLTYVASFEGALRSPATSVVTLAERDLRSLVAWRDTGRTLEDHLIGAASPALAQGWSAQRARRSPAFTRWDGYTGPLPESLLRATLDREHSPTALQRWASCPHQYLLAALLGVAERDEPELNLRISPLERGSLVHAVLEAFLREHAPDAPDSPWTPEDRARLGEIATAACDQAEARGITGARLLWRHDRARILRDVEAFADDDESFRAANGVVPVAMELSFGGQHPVSVTLPDGRVVRLRGFIDRVDQSPDGARTVVLDYKSGSRRPYQDLAADPVQSGRLLQLPIYALGARSQYQVRDVEARYWFTGSDLDDRQRFAGYEVTEEVLARLHEVLGSILDGVGAGVFPAVPGKREYGASGATFANCRFCPFDDICPRDRATALERKAGAPEMLPYLTLAPLEASPEEDEDGGA